jgi:hypothetical protein
MLKKPLPTSPETACVDQRNGSFAAEEITQTLRTLLKFRLAFGQANDHEAIARKIEEVPRMHEYVAILEQLDRKVFI